MTVSVCTSNTYRKNYYSYHSLIMKVKRRLEEKGVVSCPESCTNTTTVVTQIKAKRIFGRKGGGKLLNKIYLVSQRHLWAEHPTRLSKRGVGTLSSYISIKPLTDYTR